MSAVQNVLFWAATSLTGFLAIYLFLVFVYGFWKVVVRNEVKSSNYGKKLIDLVHAEISKGEEKWLKN